MGMTKEAEDIFDRALELWGATNMRGQVQEECAELVVALSHLRRDREGCLEEVIEEIADVLIMVEHLRRATQPEAVDIVVARKLERLRSRIDREEGRRAAGLPPRGDDGRDEGG